MRRLLCLAFWGGLAAAGLAQAEEPEEALKAILRGKTVQGAEITRIEPAAPHPDVKGVLVGRAWAKNRYGEFPSLYFLTEDRRHLLLGELWDLSKPAILNPQLAGKPLPRTIPSADLSLDEGFAIGDSHAKIRVVFFGNADDPAAVAEWRDLMRIYRENPGKLRIFYKFLPIGEVAARKLAQAACHRGEEFFKRIDDLLGGKEPAEGTLCEEERIRGDKALARSLGFVKAPLILVNEKVVFGSLNKSVVEELSGERL
jgi:hypothetical protein